MPTGSPPPCNSSGLVPAGGAVRAVHLPKFAQKGDDSVPHTEAVISFTRLSPLVALIAGILILIIPRLLNYIVALYLIVIGLMGLLGR